MAGGARRAVRVGLFIPCYVDQLRPEVGLAALALLEEQGVHPEYPKDQTCCGQPFTSAGACAQARRLARRFARVCQPYDWVVTPSGSCAASVRRDLPRLVPGASAARVAAVTLELCEFLYDVLGVRSLGGRFAARIGLHAGCHALRLLGLGLPSEGGESGRPDPARSLLESVEGVELVTLERGDECCGFGGVFAVEQPAISARMGVDRLLDHERAGAQWVTSTDLSCLLHLQGLAERHGRPVRALHIAELLEQRERA